MSGDPEPDDALSPEAFYSLYLGGLAVESETQRRKLCYTLLLIGRLGLTPGELLHLHEAWVGWARGEMHVPAHDPCACAVCWEQARVRQRGGDGRAVEEIVTTDMWAPSEGGERTLVFGWSKRLTAAIDSIIGTRPYIDADTEELRVLLDTAAENANGITPDAVSFRTLRASAIQLYAWAGFGPRRLADLFVIDEQTAGAFARVGGGELRNHLYRDLDQELPSVCGENSEYRLVCEPTRLDREPFRPADYDPEWRAERSERSEKRARNPRPPDPPADNSFEPSEQLQPVEPAGDSGHGIVDRTLQEWITEQEVRREPARHSDTAAGTAASSEEEAATDVSTTTDDTSDTEGSEATMSDMVTEPVEFSISTRFVSPEIGGGRPRGGITALGQHELLFLVRDETGAADSLLLSLDQITGLVADYVPEPLEGLFDNTAGISFERGGNEQIVVCELSPEIQAKFITTVFCRILSGIEVVVTHPSHIGGNQTDESPTTQILDAHPRKVTITDPEDDDAEIRIRLVDIVYLEEDKLTHGSSYQECLSVWHLQNDGPVITTEIRPLQEQFFGVFEQYLKRDYDRRKMEAAEITLSPEETELLEAMRESEEGRDLITMLDKSPAELSNILNSLEHKALVEQGDTGVRLTGKGYLKVGELPFER